MHDRVCDFSDGFARVKLNGKFGFINEDGEEVCKPKYIKAKDVKNGVAEVGYEDSTFKIRIYGNSIKQ